MLGENEPYCLAGRHVALVGPEGLLKTAIAAAITQAGAMMRSAVSYGRAGAVDVLVVNLVASRLECKTEDPHSANDVSGWSVFSESYRELVQPLHQLANQMVPAMQRNQMGRIIVVVNERTPDAASVSARSSLAAWVQSEALRLAPCGITANMIVVVETDVARIESMGPEIAAAVLYFAGEGTRFVTGQTLHLCDCS